MEDKVAEFVEEKLQSSVRRGQIAELFLEKNEIVGAQKRARAELLRKLDKQRRSIASIEMAIEEDCVPEIAWRRWSYPELNGELLEYVTIINVLGARIQSIDERIRRIREADDG